MNTTVNPAEIQPREVANKSKKKALLDAIRMTLDVQSAAVRHNTQTFNRNRYAATALIGDYDELKDRAVWVVDRFSEMSDHDIRVMLSQVYDQWSREFQVPEQPGLF